MRSTQLRKYLSNDIKYLFTSQNNVQIPFANIVTLIIIVVVGDLLQHFSSHKVDKCYSFSLFKYVCCILGICKQNETSLRKSTIKFTASNNNKQQQ